MDEGGEDPRNLEASTEKGSGSHIGVKWLLEEESKHFTFDQQWGIERIAEFWEERFSYPRCSRRPRICYWKTPWKHSYRLCRFASRKMENNPEGPIHLCALLVWNAWEGCWGISQVEEAGCAVSGKRGLIHGLHLVESGNEKSNSQKSMEKRIMALFSPQMRWRNSKKKEWHSSIREIRRNPKNCRLREPSVCRSCILHRKILRSGMPK